MPYDDLVMDHIQHARNYRVPEDANRRAHGSNPLCGDDVSLHLKLEGDRIADAGFQCSCCGISMASASMLTESVVGCTAAEARRHARSVIERIAARVDPNDAGDERVAALLATVREFPTRAGCATLPWLTLEAALEGRAQARLGDPVSGPSA
jgi:nitrogen fixation NifU-like protein